MHEQTIEDLGDYKQRKQLSSEEKQRRTSDKELEALVNFYQKLNVHSKKHQHLRPEGKTVVNVFICRKCNSTANWMNKCSCMYEPKTKIGGVWGHLHPRL